jgi:hypothetical protein
MNDCSNAEIRDQLPDLLHERLDVSARAAVVAHVSDCVDCRDELQLLRDVQAMIARRTPRVDVNYVVGALPKAPVRTPLRVERARPVWADWRIAAAVTLLLAGGGSFALMNSDRPESATGSAIESLAVASTPAPAPMSAASTTAAVDSKTTTVEAPTDNRLDDLSEDQLKTLLDDISKMKAVPATEPEPVSIQVSAKVGSEGL